MSQPIRGKTVYIFGAGASVHAGAPLLNNFLAVSQGLHQGTEHLTYIKSFEKLFSWITDLKRSTASVKINYSNLEEIFSLASMTRELNTGEWEGLYEHLLNVIFETLDKTISFKLIESNQYHKIYGDAVTYRFVEDFVGRNLSRRDLCRENTFERDSIITFNYDLLLDLAFHAKGVGADYCLDTPQEEGYKLLKLHGSMNWAVHENCTTKSGIHVASLDDLLSQRSSSGGVQKLGAYASMRKSSCESCSKVGLTPVFVPPTWTKSPSLAGLSNVWAAAAEEIQGAEQIVVIGYSLPPTDTFFQYLLALGLRKNTRLNRVVIVNPDMSPDYGNRFKNIFSQSIKVQSMSEDFGSAVTFENFVKTQPGYLAQYV